MMGIKMPGKAMLGKAFFDVCYVLFHTHLNGAPDTPHTFYKGKNLSTGEKKVHFLRGSTIFGATCNLRGGTPLKITAGISGSA